MKKILALVLAIVMMASMSVVAFATETQTNVLDAAGNVGGTEIAYTTSQAYTVSIPANFTLAANTPVEKTVTVSNYLLAKGATLTISITSENIADGNWVLQAANADNVVYSIEKKGTPDNTSLTPASSAFLTATTNAAPLLTTAL